MASTIRIKRSAAAGNPSTLAAGELAYSALTDGGYLFNGGDRLYIGMGTETTGNAANHYVIGGKFFTDMLDHAKGTLTASSAILVDADSKIDKINVGNITVTGSSNTISSTNSNGNIYLDPNGTGVINFYNAYSFPTTNGTAGYVLTAHSNGAATWELPATQLDVAGDSGAFDTVDLLTQTLTISGTSGQGIITSTNGGQTITITASNASDTQKGVAKFDTSGFQNASGNITLATNVAQGFAGDSGTATPANNSLDIIGDLTSGVATSASGHQVAISVGAATSGQLGVSKYSASYLTVTGGDLTINYATATTYGIAKFPTSYFTVQSGSVSILDASSTQKGVATFDVNTLTVNGFGSVKVNDITLGTSTLTPGSTTLSVLGLNEITVGNLQLESNTLSTTNTNGNLILAPNGTGKVSISNAYTLPNVAGTTSYVLTTDGAGGSSWMAAASNLTVKDDSGTSKAVKLLTGGLDIYGDGPTGAISTAVSDGAGDYKNITISARSATTTDLGVASFSGSTFSVTSGAVDVKTGGISNSQLANSSLYLGSTLLTLGDSSGTNTSVAGLTSLTVGAVTISDLLGVNANTGNLNLDATSGFVKINGYYTLPNSAGTNGYALITNGAGISDWTEISTTLHIAGDTGIDTLNLITDTLTFAGNGTDGVSVSVTGSTVSIAVAPATTTTLGVASFDGGDFSVTGGAVLLDGSVVKSVLGDTGTLTPAVHSFTVAGSSIQGITTSATGSTLTVTASNASDTQKGVASFNSTNFTVTSGNVVSNKFTIGSTDFNLGQAATTAIAGLTQVDINNIRVTGNTISSTDTNGNIILDPNGTGVVDINNSRIINVSTPIDGNDAVNKSYADALVSGLDVKNSVRVISKVNITLSGTQTIDGVTLSANDRVLVAGQTTASENGIYDVKSGAWVRSADADNSPAGEVTAGLFTFVEEGTTWANSGFILVTANPIVLGTTALVFTQFSAAGQTIAGDGLTKSGDAINVVGALNGGIQVNADSIELASTLAGDGLTYTSGVLKITGTTDRITVNTHTVDIASTYVGQTSIITLGTVTSGTWAATAIAATHGGTGIESYATGDILYASAANTLSKLSAATDGQVLQLVSGVPAWADLDGGTY